MSQKSSSAIAVIGIEIGKNSFHVVGNDRRGAIVLRQKWSRGQLEARFANLPPKVSPAKLKRSPAKISTAVTFREILGEEIVERPHTRIA